MLLDKAKILGADDLVHRDVDVPEWSGVVRIRTMTGEERDAFDADIAEMKGDKFILKRENYMAKLVARCAVDENGVRLFTDKEASELGKKSAKAIRRLSEVAQDLNGMSREVQDEIEKK